MRALACFLLAASLALSGCVTLQTPGYEPGVDNARALMAGPIRPASVGAFTAAPGVRDRLSVRGSPLVSTDPAGFPGYLGNAVRIELANAGIATDAPDLVITGELIRNELNASGASVGRALMMARFMVSDSGRVTYDRTLSVEHEWESSFIGAIAIPAAMHNYPSLVQKLLGALFADPAFMAALAPTPAD